MNHTETASQYDHKWLQDVLHEAIAHLREQLGSLPTSSYPPGIIAWRFLERLGLLSDEESKLLAECGKTVPLEATLENWEEIWEKKGLIQRFVLVPEKPADWIDTKLDEWYLGEEKVVATETRRNS